MSEGKTKRIDVSGQVATQVRHMIARGILLPGMHLIPARIAEQIAIMTDQRTLAPGVTFSDLDNAEDFSVSRMPVREALKLLVGEGILMRDQNRGFFVPPLSSDEAKQLYRMRYLVEVELLTTLVWPAADELQALQKRVDDIQISLDKGNLTPWFYNVRELYFTIFNWSPLKILVREDMRLWSLCDRYRTNILSTRTPGLLIHNLIDAIVNQDREALLSSLEKDHREFVNFLITSLEVRGI